MKNPIRALLYIPLMLVSGHAVAEARPESPATLPRCLPPAAWYQLDATAPHAVKAADLLGDMAKRDVVLLGEHHDDDTHHQWQLQTLAALHLLRPRLAIGFESFPRRVQPVLDKWVAGELTVKDFLEQSDWKNVWNMPAELYLPLFEFARINRIPMIALNVERKLSDSVTERGWDAVPASEKEGVSRPAPASAAYQDSLFEVYRHHPQVAHKKTESVNRDDQAFRFFVESQLTWDRAMAQALAQRARAGDPAQRPLVVGIMGAAHVRTFAVPHQLRDLGVQNVGALVPVDSTDDCNEVKKVYADAVFSLPPTLDEPVPPPRLGVQVNQTDDGVVVADVSPGSLAQQTGIRRGDRILALAGSPITRTSTVVATVRLQPPGTWLPIQLRRADETLDLVIKFPPGQ